MTATLFAFVDSTAVRSFISMFNYPAVIATQQAASSIRLSSRFVNIW